VGRFLCFYRGQWEEGLPHLARGSDDELRLLAARELTGPTSPSDQADLAESWFFLAKRYRDHARRQLALHAKTWYDRCLDGLEGDAKQRAEGNLREIAVMAAGGS